MSSRQIVDRVVEQGACRPPARGRRRGGLGLLLIFGLREDRPVLHSNYSGLLAID